MDEFHDNNFDLLIIGGEVAGLSCAYWLSKIPNLKIGIIEAKKIEDWDLEHEVKNLTVGSLSHLIEIHKKFGKDKAIRNYEYMLSNLELISEELKIFQSGSYLNIYSGGTLNTFSKNSNAKLNINDIEDFIKETGSIIDEIEKYKEASETVTYKFIHDGTYNLKKLLGEIITKIKGSVSIIDQTQFVGIEATDSDDIIVKTDKGFFLTKKIIVSSTNSMMSVLPELSSRMTVKQSHIFECEVDDNEVDRTNSIDNLKDEYFYQQKNKVFYAINTTDDMSEEPSQKFSEFCQTRFTSANKVKMVHSKVSYSHEAFPLCAKSQSNPNIYYLGAFSGQSKNYAFKMAHDLVRKIKI